MFVYRYYCRSRETGERDSEGIITSELPIGLHGLLEALKICFRNHRILITHLKQGTEIEAA